jgi:membrane-associated phospholipid phosphatase
VHVPSEDGAGTIEDQGNVGYRKNGSSFEELMLLGASLYGAVVAVVALWAMVYFGTQKLTRRRARLLRPSRWDGQIPEQEWSALVYVLAYPYPLVLLAVDASDTSVARAILAFVLLVVSSGILFLLFPTAIPRSSLLRLIYRLDSGGNCIPSLHAASALLTTCLLYHLDAPHPWLGILCTLAISLAALAIRQHYLLDILAGYLLGLIVFSLVILV